MSVNLSRDVQQQARRRQRDEQRTAAVRDERKRKSCHRHRTDNTADVDHRLHRKPHRDACREQRAGIVGCPHRDDEAEEREGKEPADHDGASDESELFGDHREDECVEVTPAVVRIRKVVLDGAERARTTARQKKANLNA